MSNIIKNSLEKAKFYNKDDNSPRASFSSRPANKINIPEVKGAKVDFVYNYFTRDERVRPDSINNVDKVLELDASNTDEIYYRTVNDRLARYVKVTFSPPKIPKIFYDEDVNINTLDVDINSIVNKIMIEGATSNTVFSGVELIDTGKESKLYNMLDSSMYFMNISRERESNLGAVSNLYNVLEQKGGLKGKDKKILREAFKNLSSNNYRIAKSDVSPEIAKSSQDPISKQTFSVQFNNLLMEEMVNSSNIIPDTIYQDEIRSLSDVAGDIRSRLIETIPPVHQYNELDYDLEVKAVDVKAIPESTNLNTSNYPEIRFVGYILEKYEVLPDETIELVGRRYISNHNSYFAIDDQVRYGGLYFYKIRTVCRVKFIGTIDNPINPAINQLGIITCFMGSSGVIETVRCIEKTAPPPPANLKVKFDFESSLPKLYWEFPFNKQRDIKGFQIFKRNSINEPFRLLKEYNFDNSLIKSEPQELIPSEDIIHTKIPRTIFIDNSHNEGEKPIYAVASIDAHGMTSNYSRQVQVERNPYINKVKQTVISREGAPKPYPNIFLNNDTFIDAIKTSKYDRISLVFDPEYYDVVKTEKGRQTQPGMTTDIARERSLNLLAIDENSYRYKFHFINIDNQKDKVLEVKLATKASAGTIEEQFKVSAASFSKNNMSFQYGVE